MINKEGLRQRPSYRQLVDEIAVDKKIKLPDRRAKFMRDSPYLSFLDNETYLEMEDQQQQQNAQQQTQPVIQQVASSSGQTASVLRSIYQGASSLFGGGPTPPRPPMPPPPAPAPTPAPPEVNGNGNGSEYYSIGSPPGSPEVMVPDKNPEIMDVDDFFLSLNVLPPSAIASQVNVPPSLSSTKIDWSSFEGLYPSIEGGSSSSSSAPASQLAIENVNRTLQSLADTVMESRPSKRDTGGESAEATAKAKAKPTPKAKAPAIENPGETGGTSIFVASPETAGTGSASASSGPILPKPKAKATSSGVKKTIEKDASPRTPKVHGTKIERLTERKLRDKNLGYLVDQMQARGKKFLATELKGKGKLTKNQLAEMILKWDAENAGKPA